jgi:hypothetical protein
MPPYNNEATVERAIQSVMNQTHQNWYLYIEDHQDALGRPLSLAARKTASPITVAGSGGLAQRVRTRRRIRPRESRLQAATRYARTSTPSLAFKPHGELARPDHDSKSSRLWAAGEYCGFKGRGDCDKPHKKENCPYT